MDLFNGATAVRLRSHHAKYLVALKDEENVSLDPDAANPRALWTVEYIDGDSKHPRLKSCYGRYLTASEKKLILGLSGCKALQAVHGRLDSTVEWEPIRDGFQVKLKSYNDKFLRANGLVPLWGDSVTHDGPIHPTSQNWNLWDVEVPRSPSTSSASSPSSTPSSSPRISNQESLLSLVGWPPKKVGRFIYYSIVDDNGKVEDSVEEPHRPFTFIGRSISELTARMKEETKLSDITVCSRSPVDEKLFPLHLPLPPGNTVMNVVVVTASSRVAKSLKMPENPLEKGTDKDQSL